jgi:hypothetical protein
LFRNVRPFPFPWKSRLAERAFIHLNRTIVVDKDYRGKWLEAYKNGEVACERLGAVHLLTHGIWAFKADSIGERTDLIMGEPIDLGQVQASSSTLVLTEWKIAESQKAIDARARQAVSQSERYVVGSLASLELASHRFIVLVSEKNLKVPKDSTIASVTFRYVNIAVNPDPPSKAKSHRGPRETRIK